MIKHKVCKAACIKLLSYSYIKQVLYKAVDYNKNSIAGFVNAKVN